VRRKLTLIRKALSADIDLILKIEQESFPTCWSASSFEGELAKNGCDFLVFESDGVMAGYIIFCYIIDEAELVRVAVSEGFRNKGIAARLLHFCINNHPEVSSIHLEVEETNNGAICLYKKFGFEETGKIADYYGKGRDAVRMSVTLGRD